MIGNATTFLAEDDFQTGDCLVGVSGDPFPVERIKRKLLELESEWWTVTIDACREFSTRAGQVSERIFIDLP